jgi:hypothetical protein
MYHQEEVEEEEEKDDCVLEPSGQQHWIGALLLYSISGVGVWEKQQHGVRGRKEKQIMDTPGS